LEIDFNVDADTDSDTDLDDNIDDAIDDEQAQLPFLQKNELAANMKTWNLLMVALI
jgi:hypothetical protein